MSTNALGTFLNKLTDWKYCPPSNNLWTISFLLSTAGTGDISGASFLNLYKNIDKVNTIYSNMYSKRWSVNFNDTAGTYIANLQDKDIGFFLATDVSFNANSVTITDSQSGINSQFSGFLNFGKTQTGRNHNHGAKISFLRSNWDVNEIFIDKWIAAIGQQGLIEDSSLANIKSNIIITEYACSVPGRKATTWWPRKRITLTRAFPYNREQNTYSYSPDSAGEFKSINVDFEFDAYQIEYFALPAGSTSTGTPGYISGTTAVGTSEVGPTYTSADIERINAGKEYK